MILEVWGNGAEVVIRYIHPVLGGKWAAASKWLGNNSNLNDNWLKKNGYRKIKYES